LSLDHIIDLIIIEYFQGLLFCDSLTTIHPLLDIVRLLIEMRITILALNHKVISFLPFPNYFPIHFFGFKEN
jgi:hypothetical protein